MDTLNHADQMRLANLINDNSDDAEIQKKMDQVVELTNSTRDQATVALHDCHYDVEKAVDMILEGDHNIVENQWKSAGKRKNKNVSQSKAANQAGSGGHHGSNKHIGSNRNHPTSSSNSGGHSNAGGGGAHHAGGSGRDSHHHHQLVKGNSHFNAAAQTASNNQSINNNTSSSNSTSGIKQDATDSLKNMIGITSSNLITSSDSANSPSAAVATNKSSLSQQQQQQQHQAQQQSTQQSRQKGTMQAGGNRQHQRSTKIPESAVEMPNNEFQVSSLNVQFGELDLKDGNVNSSDSKGAFQDVLESSRLGRQAGLPNSHSALPSQDNKGGRQLSQQQHLGKGGPRRPYNNTGDDRRFYNNSRGGRPPTSGPRPYNQRAGPMNNNNVNANSNTRGVRTIMNRGLQPNSGLTQSSASQQASGGFPNSIDTWTNSTAEAATKQPPSQEQSIGGVGGTLRVGQWSDVTANEDWSEEEHWDAKVMETKVFTPSSKAVDGPQAGKNQSILTDTSAPSQMNLKSKISEASRDVINSQASTLTNVTQPVQSQSSQKPLSHMNDIFDPSVAKAVLEQQNLAAMKPKSSIGMSQYGKDSADAKAILDSQNLSSIKPKTNMSMNQYNKEASESLKSLVGISTSTSSSSGNSKGVVPSVPPGALPSMIQPHQYIMGNAYQPAIFPYAYQAPDVHYPGAAPIASRDQNFQSVYSPSDGNKFSRGADGDAPSITTTQTAPVASQTHNQAFVANQLHAGYQLTYAMPGTFNMMPQNLYGAAPIFPHIPQPTNTGSANTVYQKNTPASYQHHTGYSGYDQLNPLIQDYVKQQQSYSGSAMQHQPTSKASGVTSDIDVTTGGSYNMYGSVNKGQGQATKQTSYNDVKGYQQQMSNNGPQQQFGFTHNAQQPSSMTNYPLLQQHNLDNSDLNQQGGVQSQLQHSSGQRGGSQVNQSKYYPSWS